MEHEKLAKSHGILEMEIEKWSWKSHGQIFCQVCGNPDKTHENFPIVEETTSQSILSSRTLVIQSLMNVNKSPV